MEYISLFFLVAPYGKRLVLPQETRNMPLYQGYISLLSQGTNQKALGTL